MPLIMETITTLHRGKNGSVDVTIMRDHAPKAPRAVWAKYAECSGHFQYTLCNY